MVIDELNRARLVSKPATKNRERISYYELSVSFDIETSSWYEGDEKRSCMYIWQICFNGYMVYGRTWEQFVDFFSHLTKYTDITKRLIIYVHNLSYEYGFIKDYFEWEQIVQQTDRNIVSALTKDGIEFRCSYALTGEKLETIGEQLGYAKLDYDYSKIRHSATPLSEDELSYCLRDVEIVYQLIKEKIEKEGITHIPLTKTGYVRKRCRKALCQDYDYQSIMRNLTITQDAYEMAKQAFQGGYVHCNLLYSGRTLDYIGSFDLTSSYPTSLVAYDRFPMSKPHYEKVRTEQRFRDLIDTKCCIFYIEFKNIRLKDTEYIPPISSSKCFNYTNIEEDNGRVLRADQLTTCITEIDFEIYEQFYDWDGFRVGKLYWFKRGRLPKALIEVIMEIYEMKTTLKGIDDKEYEYLLNKAMLNSIYGMMCTDITKQAENIDAYNKDKYRFCYYPWGVYCAALSRRALFSGIKAIGEDFVYCDTDSLKIRNPEKHIEYFERYNKWIQSKIKQTLNFYGLPLELAYPENIDGVKCQLGVWTDEGIYDKMKALRAKAYLSKKNGHYSLTCSGLSKSSIEYIKTVGEPFSVFKIGMEVDALHTGKLTHTYLDFPTEGTVCDYLGNCFEYKERTSVHMEPAPFKITEDDDDQETFINFVSLLLNEEDEA